MILTCVVVFGVQAGSTECAVDADNDGICDDTDNCLGIKNPAQYDADRDGYGNICDYDVDNDCTVGVRDNGATIAATAPVTMP